jgi:DNA-binding NarL/FixJ family response regulator
MKSIFIVDDHAAVRGALRRFLEAETKLCVCGEAGDGVEALDKVAAVAPDLILLDLAMPRMNGIQTARELRARGVSVPIILFTLYAESVQPGVAEKAKIDAVVMKDDLDELKNQIDALG